MKIIVFGATGTVGKHVVEQALAQGHQVTAFTRNPASIALQHQRLEVAQGDVTDPESAAKAVAGHDAVIVALGGGRNGGVRAPGTAAVIEAMRQTGVRRLVVQSTLGAGDSEGNLNFWWKRVMFGLLLRPAYADHQLQEQHTQRSDLDWTIVRPSAFTDGPHTGEYLTGFGTDAKTKLKISRADVADFVLRALQDEKYVRKTPAVSY